jgi:hypothetical protein
VQALLCLGRAASALDDIEQSRSWFEQALTIARQLEDRWSVAYALNELSQQTRRGGQLEEALLEECQVLWRESGTRMGERAAVMNLALVTLERGALTRSTELAREGLELSQDMRDDGSATVRCVEIAAQVLGALASTPTAVTLLASATTRRDALSAPRPSVETPELDRLLDAARNELGASVFYTAWRHGETCQSMTRSTKRPRA